MKKVTVISLLSGAVLSAAFFAVLTLSVGKALQPNAQLLADAVSCREGVAGNPGKELMCGAPAADASLDLVAAHAGSVAERNG